MTIGVDKGTVAPARDALATHAPKVIRIHPADNVAVALHALAVGDEIIVDGATRSSR